MTPTCAICGYRDATERTEWDGREIAACTTCMDPVEVDPEIDDFEIRDTAETDAAAWFASEGRRGGSGGRSQLAMLSVVASHPGMSLSEIMDRLGVPPGERASESDTFSGSRRHYNRILSALRRCVRSGLVVAEGRKFIEQRFRPAPNFAEVYAARQAEISETRRQRTSAYHERQRAERRAA